MWTCARQSRNGICAQLRLIRFRCSYEEALCPCLPIKRVAKTLIRLGGWLRCRFLRFSMIFGPIRGRIARDWKMSMHSFQRWDSADLRPVESHAWSKKAPIHVGSTGPVFASYWSGRLAVGCCKAHTASARARPASEGAPAETRGVHVRVHATLGQKSQEHRENRENACDFVRTSHGPQIPMAPPKSYELGYTRGSYACDLSIRYFMPW